MAWVNNRKAGDLRRHRPQYDVIVMTKMINTHIGMRAGTFAYNLIDSNRNLYKDYLLQFKKA